LRACAGAKTVLAGSFLNLGALAEFIKQLQPAEVLLVCAGTRENLALEDALAAGALCVLLDAPRNLPLSPLGRGEGVRRRGEGFLLMTDSAQIAWRTYAQAKSDLPGAIRVSENARRLLAIPELRDDVAFCLQRDVFPLIARMEADGAIRRQPA
jgi:phosphosulfolactate phosphohydrolase-like enzyme